jgi:hypothetical protein
MVRPGGLALAGLVSARQERLGAVRLGMAASGKAGKAGKASRVTA